MRLRLMWTMAIGAVALAGCNDRTGGPDAGSTDQMDARTSGGMENTPALCSDGVDNDGDTHADCNDLDCCEVVSCGAATSCGRRPDGGRPRGAACDGPSEPENTLQACMDNCSNDHDDDLYVDCDDYDCCDVRTDCPAGTLCGNRGRGACEGEPVPENTLPRCTDGCSNDHDEDTYPDCRERDCCWLIAEAVRRGETGVEACPTGTYCADAWTAPVAASLCDDDDLTGPPGRENSFERCSDECSNDRDSYQDCGDYKCCAIIARAVERGVEGATACGAATQCGDGTWEPLEGFPRGTDTNLCDDDDATGEPDAENTLERCTDECDNDRDGYEDCDDHDCCRVEGITCGAGTACGDD